MNDMLDPNKMAEATRLTRAGRLAEATAFLQRMLRGAPPPDMKVGIAGDIVPAGGQSLIIDATAQSEETDRPPSSRVCISSRSTGRPFASAFTTARRLVPHPEAGANRREGPQRFKILDEEIQCLPRHLVARVGAWRQDHGVRMTRQRRLLFELIDGSGEHLNAESLYRLAKQRDSKINRVTVYRTLKLLKQEGLVDELGTFQDAVRSFKRELVRSALRMHSGNKLKAARELGISRCYLHRLLNQLNITEFSLDDEESSRQESRSSRDDSRAYALSARAV